MLLSDLEYGRCGDGGWKSFERQKYAESLDRVIQNNHNYLKGIMNDFEEKCMLVTSVKTAPPRIVIEIPETYRGMQSRIKEISAIQQLLRAKYFLYARKDPRRDKEISDLGYVAKTAFSKFEHVMKQIEAEGRLREAERPPEVEIRQAPFSFSGTKRIRSCS